MRWGWAGIALLAGCAQILGIGEPTLEATAGPDAGFDATPTEITVEGRFSTRYFDEFGVTTEVGEDLAGLTMFVRETPTGPLVERDLEDLGDGRFRATQVPTAEAYYLRRVAQDLRLYVVSRTPTPKLLQFRAGRPGPDVDNHQISISSSAMAAWAADDAFFLASDRNGGGGFPMGSLPAVGATTLTNQVFRWNGPLLDPALSDSADLYHLSAVTSSTGVVGRVATERMTFLPPSTDDMIAVDAPFFSLARPYAYRPVYDAAAFDGLYTGLYPTAATGFAAQLTIVHSSSGSLRSQRAQPTLFRLTPAALASPDLGEVLLPEPGRLIRILGHSHDRTVTLPGTAIDVVVSESSARTDALGAGGDDAIAPRIGPVREPRIAGGAPFASVTIPYTNPPVVSVTWEPPALGVATHYELLVYRYDAGSMQLQATVALWTPATSIILPPDGLEAGQSYVVSVFAENNPAYAVGEEMAEAIPFDYTGVVVGAFTLTP